MKKSKKNVVYSTNPDFNYEHNSEGDQETLSNGNQQLRIYPDKKNRKGKTVTIITGFVGSSEDLKSLEKKLKSMCGSGGTVKDGDILLQGNFIKKVSEYFDKEGYKYKISGV